MSVGLVRAALLLAAVAAVEILLGLLGTAADVIALAAIVLALVATAPAGRSGAGWWSLLAAGACLSVLGALLALVTEPVGGVVAVLGAVAVLAAAASGFPVRA
ncbi:MAG: hypothetical protein EDQ89_07615 [Acidobacteria bacterium]|nr:MAG: hypothetical protein EDQ89_07615 [Acidobacteriota bacterium]